MNRPHPLRLFEYLEHILEAIDRAADYAGEASDALDFERNGMAQDAVIRCIQIIGEAATKILKVDRAFTERHPEVPWEKMTTMRNRLIHDYFEVDLDIVWSTVQQDLPDLRRRIGAILQSKDPSLRTG